MHATQPRRGLRNPWWWVLGVFVFGVLYVLVMLPIVGGRAGDVAEDCVFSIFDGTWEARDCLGSSASGVISYLLAKWILFALLAALTVALVIAIVVTLSDRRRRPATRRSVPSDQDIDRFYDD